MVVNVWGSWCAPCKREQPDLQRAFTDAQPLGVRFLGLAVRDTAPNARAHLRRYGVGYPSILDEGLRLVARFRDLPPTAIPSTVVVDRDGRVAATFLGPVGYDELMPMLRRLAAEQ